jgi:pimeloyl-ACP methyl ester carboxylesterase
MGGWLALLAAMQRQDRVRGLLGIAAAPDFTDWGYSAEDKDALRRDGKLEQPNPYGPEPSVTWLGFWQSGAEHRLLNNVIDLIIPVRLIHGEQDQEVGLGVALKLMSDLRSSDVQLRIVKNGGHRLSEPHEIHAILVELHGLVERIA